MEDEITAETLGHQMREFTQGRCSGDSPPAIDPKCLVSLMAQAHTLTQCAREAPVNYARGGWNYRTPEDQEDYMRSQFAQAASALDALILALYALRVEMSEGASRTFETERASREAEAERCRLSYARWSSGGRKPTNT